jgi:hypothetical protein
MEVPAVQDVLVACARCLRTCRHSNRGLGRREQVGAGWLSRGSGLGLLLLRADSEHQEAQLLKDLLTGFNERYDKLNDDLDIPEDCKPQEVGRFNSAARDYFNLCAEEYLFWNLGYILPSVWSAWSAGMRRRFKDPRIQGIWGVEVEAYRESYYGFD